jgi:hypothetical protein
VIAARLELRLGKAGGCGPCMSAIRAGDSPWLQRCASISAGWAGAQLLGCLGPLCCPVYDVAVEGAMAGG